MTVLTCLIAQRSNTNMPTVGSPAMARVKWFHTSPGNRKANASNTPNSNRDYGSPATSSVVKKSGFGRVWGSLKTFGKGASKDLQTSPSPRNRRRGRQPIPEFPPADPQEISSTKVYYDHSESHERLETASARSAKSKPMVLRSLDFKADLV
jgi:hypothetical protein